MGQIRLLWGKNGEVFWSCISASDSEPITAINLFEPPDMILYHEKTLIQGQTPAEREKKLSDAPHAPDRDMSFDMVRWVT